MPFLKKIFGKKPVATALPSDMEEEFKEIHAKCSPFTMTSVERMYALYKAVNYICEKGVPGDFVECGVWKGGSSMVAAHTFKKRGDMAREMHLYDTFEGMSDPGENDVRMSDNKPANELLTEEAADKLNSSNWCIAPVEEVKKNLVSTGYPEAKMNFIKGKVEETIPGNIPGKIALLRLDTDWFESTQHELVHLFPLLSTGGVLIIDDYGHWKGSKLAVDSYFSEHKISLLLNRVDYTGRLGVKL